jgi:hypothetical protein
VLTQLKEEGNVPELRERVLEMRFPSFTKIMESVIRNPG